MNYIVGSNADKFFQEYARQLERALVEHPEEYQWPASELPNVLQKMCTAIERGTANKDSRAIKGTCKVLGIKHTYTAIRQYLAEVPV
jgi:hypothetical protein